VNFLMRLVFALPVILFLGRVIFVRANPIKPRV
jgi:hypothetical protein